MLMAELLDTANIVDASAYFSTPFELFDKQRYRRGTIWTWAARWWHYTIRTLHVPRTKAA